MVNRITICLGAFMFIVFSVIAGCSTAQTQEKNAKEIRVVRFSYQADNSRLYLPQMQGMADRELQNKVNSNLKSAILAIKNQRLGSSINGDFEVTFYNGLLLGIHFQGSMSAPGMAYPTKIDCGIHIDLTNGRVYKLEDLFVPGTDYEKYVKDLCGSRSSRYRTAVPGLENQWDHEMFSSSWMGMDRMFLLSSDNMRVYTIPSWSTGAISGYAIPYVDMMPAINKEGELWKKLMGQSIQSISVQTE